MNWELLLLYKQFLTICTQVQAPQVLMNGWIDGWMDGWMDGWIWGGAKPGLKDCYVQSKNVPFSKLIAQRRNNFLPTVKMQNRYNYF